MTEPKDVVERSGYPGHMSQHNARFAIDGALAFGLRGINPPPEGHWLTEYWNIGRDLSAARSALGECTVRVTNIPDGKTLHGREAIEYLVAECATATGLRMEAEAALAAAERELEQYRNLRTDKAAVRVNLIQGGIARPDDMCFMHDTHGPWAALKAEKEEDGWIPVNERLPENGEWSLLWDGRRQWCGRIDAVLAAQYGVTHYMPLPAPPQAQAVREAQPEAPYWLIERDGPYGTHHGCEWWVSGEGNGHGTMLREEWTTDSAKAQHFNEWGAKHHAKELESWGVKGLLRATEHVDCAGPAPLPPAAGPAGELLRECRKFIAGLRVPQDQLQAGLQIIEGGEILDRIDAHLKAHP